MLNLKVKKIIFKILGYSFSFNNLVSTRDIFKFYLFQRVLRINSHVAWPVHISSQVIKPEKIIFQKEMIAVGYSIGCYIQANNGISLGTNVYIGPGVKIISSNHDTNCLEKHVKTDSIVLNDNCWIGANAVILPGVELGRNTVVGAGSIVIKSFKQGNQVIAGNPAKVIKEI